MMALADDTAETIALWDYRCHEYGKGSAGGIGGTLTRNDPPEFDEQAAELVEQALVCANQAGATRTVYVIRRFYLRAELYDAPDAMGILARILYDDMPDFRARDGMTNDQRARRWLDRALITLDGVASAAKLV